MAQAGQRIGPYRLLSVLGQGAMGVVWRARDERLDRLVALKLLPRDQKSNAERRARMLREAKAAASIPHNNVVTLFDIVSDGDDDVLVMELVDGSTLADVVAEQGPLSLEDALEVLIELCDALAAAHERGILHRDIKSANVMRGKDGSIKVLDFGLAKLRETIGVAAPTVPAGRAKKVSASPEEIALGQTLASVDEREMSESRPDQLLMTRAGQILGTPLYMAPEQFAGEAPTVQSEVFAVGVVGYELLAGAPPFVGSSYDELQERVFNDAVPELPADIPRAGTEVIARALCKEPDDRYDSMAEFGDALRQLRATRSAPEKRTVLILALVALAALAIIALAAVLTLRDRGQESQQASERPGDAYVRQALREHNLFYNQKAAASIRAAIRQAPDHPLAYAYAILFPTEEGTELDNMLGEAIRVRGNTATTDRDRALLETAIALAQRGPSAARDVLDGAELESDGEISFWLAELAYRARDYEGAGRGFSEALEVGDASFAGRIYDHYSAVLSYLGEFEKAAEIGKRYADAFPGEPDAVGVYATTLAGVGKLDRALAAATEALRLYRGEDTIAGLAKVHALRGEIAEARALYARSAAMASDQRRPIRNAALGYLAWLEGDIAAANDAVADCLPGGSDDSVWERGQCLWVAGIASEEKTEVAIVELERLAAAATRLRPAYGSPAKLVNLLKARRLFFRGGCQALPQAAVNLSPVDVAERTRLLQDGRDFYASYHIPLFNKYAACELEGVAEPN